MLSNLVKAIRNKPEPELPSYVNFDEPLGVLKEFAEHEGLIEAQMALQGGGLNPTHEGFVKELKSDALLFKLSAADGRQQIISDANGKEILRVFAAHEETSLGPSSDFEAYSLPQRSDDNPVLVVRNAGRNLGGVELLGKFRNAASGKEGLETSEAVEIACGTRGFSNAFGGKLHVEIQKKAVAVITWNQDQLNHPLYALKIDPNVDSSLVVACLLLYHRLVMDRRQGRAFGVASTLAFA